MRTFLIALLVVGFAWTAHAQKPIEGMINLKHDALGEPTVEVNLSGSLFKLAANIVSQDEPELSSLLMELKALHVRVYSQDAVGADPKQVTADLDRRLRKEGWEVLARVREEGNNVGVYILGTEDAIRGLCVLVAAEEMEFEEADGALVLVNIAGNIDLTKVGKLGKVAGIDLDLPDLGLEEDH